MRYLDLVSISVFFHWELETQEVPFKSVFWMARVRLTSGPQKSLMLFPSSSCSAVSLFLSVCLSLSISQDISLSSVPVEQNRVSVPAGDSREISARSFLGHHMKGSMRQTGDAVDVCVCLYVWLFVYAECV